MNKRYRQKRSSKESEASATEEQGQAKVIAAIPCFNEERFIGSVVLKTKSYVDERWGDDNWLHFWPFDLKWLKRTPKKRIKELAKAGALIAAEIDRLQRTKE